MVEREVLGVQEEPAEGGERLAVTAVAPVTDHGMTDRLQMHTDLVRAPRVEGATQQRHDRGFVVVGDDVV